MLGGSSGWQGPSPAPQGGSQPPVPAGNPRDERGLDASARGSPARGIHPCRKTGDALPPVTPAAP